MNEKEFNAFMMLFPQDIVLVVHDQSSFTFNNDSNKEAINPKTPSCFWRKSDVFDIV